MCSCQCLSTSDDVPCDSASKHVCKTPNKEHRPTSGTKNGDIREGHNSKYLMSKVNFTVTSLPHYSF